MTLPKALRMQRWPWLPGVLCALVGVVASAALWQQQSDSVARIARERFTQEARSFSSALENRIASHTELVVGLRSLFLVNPRLGRADFEHAARELRLAQHYPGVKNVAFTRYVALADKEAYEARVRADDLVRTALASTFAIRPPGDRPEYHVADYIWPTVGNEYIVGLDVGSLPATMASIRYSRDTGQIVASEPFDLLQERENRAGFVIRLPVFDDSAAGVRRYIGSVAATIRFYDMVKSLQSEGQLRGVAMSVRDIGSVRDVAASSERPLLALESGVRPAMERYERELLVHDRRWRLTFQPLQPFLSHSEAQLPALMGGGGLLVTVLLSALITLLVRRRTQAVSFATAAGSALRESEERFRALFNQAAVGVAQVEAASRRFVRANSKFCDILGYTEAELSAKTVGDITHPDDLMAGESLMQQIAQGQIEEFRYEKRYFHKDGRVIWADLTVTPMRIPGNPATHSIAVVQDITERKQMEESQRDSELRLRGILYRLPVGVCLVRKDGGVSFRNERFVQICGYTADDAPTVDDWWRLAFPDAAQREQAIADWLAVCAEAPGDEATAAREHAITCKGGQLRTVDLAGVVLGDDRLITLVDMSQHKAAEEEIRYLAYYDPLTQLPNRRLLLDRLQQALAASTRSHRCGAVLMLDLDNFKTLNETQGHERGDMLLRQVALRLRDCVQTEDTVARHGGDEFVVVLEDLGDSPEDAAARAEEMGQKILTALRRPFVLEGEAHHSTLSMGVTIFQGVRETVDELLQRADLAMYQAKAGGRNSLQFYDPRMQASVAARAALESDLREGIALQQFELFYQPQMDNGRITGAEALLRWRHPVRGFVSPGEFIPLTEETGLILPLGEWVLQAACAQLARWAQQPALAHLGLSVNVSARQFHQSGFVGQVLAALASTGADGRRLKLEMTESLLLQDVEDTIDKMAQLRAYGVGFSLDDFGTGYSSLAYLKRLPLDELKIDQSFVRDVLTDPNDAAIARTIVALGTSLGLRVIAEGVETEAQRAFLARNQCYVWQGYLLSPPLPVDGFERLVVDHAAGQSPLIV
ncbi:bifunctional diguanylate cyclase/phosphodiesterase [Acidovorax sp. NCPPB 3576]|uniref:bifunctional diguanylate cyclase/phosphodiesterase n=1 Tax=Acidovorax sp. NCPPB 3576 TaxID=2940488 RepID=UPI003FA482D1